MRNILVYFAPLWLTSRERHGFARVIGGVFPLIAMFLDPFMYNVSVCVCSVCGEGRCLVNLLLENIPFSLLQNFMELICCQIHFTGCDNQQDAQC